MIASELATRLMENPNAVVLRADSDDGPVAITGTTTEDGAIYKYKPTGKEYFYTDSELAESWPPQNQDIGPWEFVRKSKAIILE